MLVECGVMVEGCSGDDDSDVDRVRRTIAAVMIVVAVMVEGCSGDDGRDLVK